MKELLAFMMLFPIISSQAQNQVDSLIIGDVKLSFDVPETFAHDTTVLILYALPNGNTTAQTMGKRMQPGDDWHFNIQHIAAQTGFIRETFSDRNVVVVYLENTYKSWPLWKQNHRSDYRDQIRSYVDLIYKRFPGNKQVQLNGHSGGGSFIFGVLDSYADIPHFISRISFLDSNYGYDEKYFPQLERWLKTVPHSTLTVMAYNDSAALYNGKPVVSPTGGTWYRSHLMLEHFGKEFPLQFRTREGLTEVSTKEKNLGFFLKENPDRSILHTIQVERNGFIHSVLFGTPHENEGYHYYADRAYEKFIKN